MKYKLGLDLGTNSVGWALVGMKDSEVAKSEEIINMGSRIIPMGTERQDYEKGIGITKNADRRIAKTARKMNKRYKLRRNKLLYIFSELEMLPEQFQFKDGIPKATELQKMKLLPIKKGTLQLDSLKHYEIRVKALQQQVTLKEFAKILYQFNQKRGYAGGDNKEEVKSKHEKEDNEEEKKKYEVITKKVIVLKVVKTENVIKTKKSKKIDQEECFYEITVEADESQIMGITMLQNLEEGKEEELEIRIKHTKKGDSVVFALPAKTNWRKQLEKTEELLKTNNLFVSQLLLKDLIQNKWTKIKNRVILRQRYQEEFDAVWAEQAKYYPVLENCPKDKLEKIVNYLFPGTKQSQMDFRKDGINKGIRHIIRNQVIYYQRPLKDQTDLISKCKFEKDEKVVPISNPLFQEFRCWDQINRLYITSKIHYDGKYKYTDRYLTDEQKYDIYNHLRIKKQVGYNEVAKIIELKTDKTEYLNGLHIKAKLKGCDTFIQIKSILAEHYDQVYERDNNIIDKIWRARYYNSGNEYDVNSPILKALTSVLKNIVDETNAIALSLKLAQNISYTRKYSNLSEKAIARILPLMVCGKPKLDEDIISRYERIKNTINTGEYNEVADIEPYMLNYVSANPNIIERGGMMYAFAASLAYGKHTADNIKPFITDYHQIQYKADRNTRNPIVEQVLNETMQIIKALWKKYNINMCDLEIRVELARELKNSASEREKIFKGQMTNQGINESIRKHLLELKEAENSENIEKYKLWRMQSREEAPKQSKDPTNEEIEKMRIWEEQKCISPYTLNPIPLSKLFTREYDVDHIIPKSRLFDDSISNKVVCESLINEEKSNLTAWEYITKQRTKYEICSVEDYIRNINDHYYGKKKRNLLLENIPNNIVERQIKDTQYISVAVKNELAQLVGSENVKTTTGEVTSFLRSRWGLKKIFMELTENRFRQMELWDSGKLWVNKYYDKDNNKNILGV